jgi:hypothetical protein
MAAIAGYVNLRTLRPLDQIRVHGSRMFGDSGSELSNVIERRAVGLRGEGYLLQDFCSPHMPECRNEIGEVLGRKWASTSLVHPSIGNTGTTTVMFGEYYLLREFFKTFGQTIGLPTEVAIQDLLIPPGLITGAPELNVFFGDDEVIDRPPDYVPLVGDFNVVRIGKGTEVLTTPDVPHYAEMANAIADRLGLDVSGHEVWRVRRDYPAYHSTSRIKWTLAGSS